MVPDNSWSTLSVGDSWFANATMSVFPMTMTSSARHALRVMGLPLKYHSQKTLVMNCMEPHAASMDCEANPSDTKFATLPIRKNSMPNQSQRPLLRNQPTISAQRAARQWQQQAARPWDADYKQASATQQRSIRDQQAGPSTRMTLVSRLQCMRVPIRTDRRGCVRYAVQLVCIGEDGGVEARSLLCKDPPPVVGCGIEQRTVPHW